MGATLATLNAITKEVYGSEGLVEQLNNEVPMLRRIEKTSRGTSNELGGRYVTFPIHTRRNNGIGARNELEALPLPGQQGTAAARIGLKYQYGAIQLSGQALKLIDSNYQAFTSALDLEVDGIKSDLAVDLNRQVWGDGTGKIGTVTAVVTGVTIAVDRPDLFQEGEQVDYVLAAGTVSQSNRQVTAINLTAKTITISGANITTVVGDYFVRTGNLNREWTGLSAIVAASGTLYNIDPTVEGSWKSVVVANGSPTAVSEGAMTKMTDDIRNNGGKTTVIVTTPGVRRAYANLLKMERQFVNVKDFKGGFSGIGFITDNGEIPVITDYMAPPGTMWYLNEDNIKLYRESDWDWMDFDGSKWQRLITAAGRFDAYESILHQYSELGISRRNTFGKTTNLIEE